MPKIWCVALPSGPLSNQKILLYAFLSGASAVNSLSVHGCCHTSYGNICYIRGSFGSSETKLLFSSSAVITLALSNNCLFIC